MRHDIAPAALLVALALGVLADLVVRLLPRGLDVVVLVAALLTALAWAARRIGAPRTPLVTALGALALVFPLAALTRDAPALIVLDVIATLIVGCTLVAALRRGEPFALDRAGPVGCVVGGVATAARIVGGGPLLAARAADASAVLRPAALAGVGTVLRGTVLAAPVLLVFALLLLSADPAFGRLFAPLAAFDLDLVGEHALVIALVAWATAGTLHAALLSGDGPTHAESSVHTTVGRAMRERLAVLRLGAREVTVALVLVDLLLVVFGTLQLRWLFGGDAALAAAGVTVAEYARRGFFELVVLAALALPLLALADALATADGTNAAPRRRADRVASAILVGIVLVLLVSATDRLRLYVDTFGLSLARFHAAALMTWLGVVFVWAAVTLLRGRPGRFAAGAVASALALLLVLHVVNPAARVADVNLDRAAAGRIIDTDYLVRLGVDAVPVLAARIPPLLTTHPDAAVRCRLRLVLHAVAVRAAPTGTWRGWRLPVARARRALPPWSCTVPAPCP